MGKAWTSGHRDELKTLEEYISLKLIFISKENFSILYIFYVLLGGIITPRKGPFVTKRRDKF